MKDEKTTYKKSEKRKEQEKKLQMEMGNRLQTARIVAGMTQEAVAFHLDITKNMYSLYETGKNSIPYTSLLELCNLFRISPNIILGYQDNSRVNAICKKYGITYNKTGYEEIEIITPKRNIKISETGFYKVLFEVQKDIEEETERLYSEQIAEEITNAFQFLLVARAEMFNIGEKKVLDAILEQIKAIPKLTRKYNALIKQGYSPAEAYEKATESIKGGKKHVR